MFAAGKAVSGATPTDAQFNYVTMLLHGDGTNGAQNNTFVDSSTNNFTITRNGNTTQGTFSPYGSNWSNFFDGSGDYLSFTGGTATSLSSNFTIEAWVYCNTFAIDAAILCIGKYNSNGGLFYVDTSGKLAFYRNGSRLYTGSGSFSLNTWTHLVFVRQGTTFTGYINGVSQGSITFSDTVAESGGVGTYISDGYATSGLAGHYINGYISNLRLVNGTAVYTTAFTPSTIPLTAITNTSLLTCQSNRFVDNSTNAFAITVNGNTSVQRFSPFNATSAYTTSVIGGSGYFDGTDDLRISTNSAFAIGTGDFTFEAWINPPSWASAVPFFVCTGTGGLWIGKNGSNFVVRAYGVADQLQYATVPTTNAWTHIVAVRSGTTLSLFYNGIRVATTTNSYSFAQQPVSIGSDGEPVAATYYTGYISNLRLVKGTAVYDPTASTLTVPTAPLTAVTNTSLLVTFTNAGILDNAMMNDLETVGNAQISTSVKKYGTGSIALDGTGDWLLFPANDRYAFGTGDYTVEAWVYFTSINSSTLQIIFASGNSGGNTFYAHVDADQISVGTPSVFISNQPSSFTTNTWYHIAFCRASGTLRLFKDGVQQGSSVTDSTNWISGGSGKVGANDAGNQTVSGYIDDLRITKGYARYTANFTPPTAAFPDKG